MNSFFTFPLTFKTIPNLLRTVQIKTNQCWCIFHLLLNLYPAVYSNKSLKQIRHFSWITLTGKKHNRVNISPRVVSRNSECSVVVINRILNECAPVQETRFNLNGVQGYSRILYKKYVLQCWFNELLLCG